MKILTFQRAAFAAILLASVPVAQAPGVLRDLASDPGDVLGSNPNEFVQLGSQVIFAATTAQAGRELWTLDPNTGQTSMLLDIAPGAASSGPHSLVVFGSFVYFCANDDLNGHELWRTDGTTAGTTLFVDLTPIGSSFVSELTVAGGQLFFSAYSDTLGRELVVSDGTVNGTQTIDIVAGPEHSEPAELTAIGSEVWFRASTAANGTELWRSNGTPAGTVLAADVNPGAADSQPGQMHGLADGDVAFLNRGEVWCTDGTPAGTRYVANGTSVTTVGNLIYFSNSNQLFASDGTAGSAQLVVTLSLSYFGAIHGLTTLGNRVIANASSGIFQPIPVTFSSDGTAAGTVQLPQAIAAPLVVAGNLGWFASVDGTSGGAAIWQTDGTAAGTTLAFQVPTGGASGHPQDLAVLTSPTRIVFSAVDQLGREPWIYDPTINAGQRLADLTTNNGVTVSSNPYEITDAAGNAFIATTSSNLNQAPTLFGSQGTETSTSALLPSGLNLPPNPRDLITVGTKLFFVTYDAQNLYRLWVSDGTEPGTMPIVLAGQTNPKDLLVAEDLLYFQCDDQFLRTNLWRTDGTQQGTFQIVPRPEYGDIGDITPLGRGVVFRYQTYTLGSEPYYNNGTPNGTVLLKDVEPGAVSSLSTQFTTIGDRCYFSNYSDRLFITDGTPAGTTELSLAAAGLTGNLSNLFAARQRLFFTGSTQTGGTGLWTSDGTVAGTTLVVELSPTLAWNLVYAHYEFGDGLLLKLWANNRVDLWHVDGNGMNPVLIRKAITGDLQVTGERQAWFQGQDSVHGQELWCTDGTIAGTKLFADLLPGPASSSPNDFAFSGGRLLFSALHPQLGREPWALDLHATSQDVGYGCTPTTTVPPRLWSDDPVLGTTAMVQVAHGPESGLGIPLISNYTTSVHALGSGFCDYFVDGGLVVLGYAITPGGMASIPLSIPNNAALEGQRFRLQALTLPVSGLLQAELSNGVTLTIGR